MTDQITVNITENVTNVSATLDTTGPGLSAYEDWRLSNW